MITGVLGDVTAVDVDVLVLKYANGHHGADLAVARKVGITATTAEAGRYKFVDTAGTIAAKQVLVIGVGNLYGFEYQQIESFAQRAVELVRKHSPATNSVGITNHGPGYGLDELASLERLVSGLEQGLGRSSLPSIQIIEFKPQRFERINHFLRGSPTHLNKPRVNALDSYNRLTSSKLNTSTDSRNRIFSAMPFKEELLDHWDLAIQPAAHQNQLVIERLDHESFTGDIVQEIRTRIERSRAVFALLDEMNPNVFLEVGYAWGVKKPTILALREGVDAPFDVRGQKMLRYNRLGELKTCLASELSALPAE